MAHKMFLYICVVASVMLLVSCGAAQPSPTPEANMPNPASVYCEENGGKLEMRQDASGGIAGICVFADGSECDEWAYFRGECKPGGAPSASPTPITDAELTSDGWVIYQNETLGYRFDYPADARIEIADNPLETLSIIGPLIGEDNWPMIFVNHPGDREDYRPPENADLAQWLTDHALLADERQPDTQIAGTMAIHTRFSRSPQAYASDSYYFARSGQLYSIVIIHTGDKEDWTVYNRFLTSFQFDQAAEEESEEAILILEPGPGSRLISPIRVAGLADPTFEQALLIRVILDDGTVLQTQPTSIQADVGQRGPFAVDVPVTVSGERQAFIQVYASSPRDGSITHLNSVGVTLLAAGQPSVAPVTPYPERIVIHQPVPNAVVSGGIVHVEGWALASFEGTLIVDVLDEAGRVVGTQPLIVTAPDAGQPGPFSADVPYTVAVQGPGTIVVRDPSVVFAGDVHRASVTVNLKP
jgi:putative hemolysin